MEKTFKEKIKDLVRNSGRSNLISISEIEKVIVEDEDGNVSKK